MSDHTMDGKRSVVISEDWTFSIKIYDCKNLQALDLAVYYLCEFDDPVNKIPEKSAITAPPVTLHPKNYYPDLVVCPLKHTVHTFLACDVFSKCWTDSPVVYDTDRQTWDVPSYTTCPAPMTSLPPSYACATGNGRVPYTFVCDHRQDCSDDSDEDFCIHPKCTGDKGFQCGSAKQVIVNVLPFLQYHKSTTFSYCLVIFKKKVRYYIVFRIDHPGK